MRLGRTLLGIATLDPPAEVLVLVPVRSMVLELSTMGRCEEPSEAAQSSEGATEVVTTEAAAVAEASSLFMVTAQEDEEEEEEEEGTGTGATLLGAGTLLKKLDIMLFCFSKSA
jgi:hypothetical protein